MKKWLVRMAPVAAALLLGSAQPGLAGERISSGQRGHGAVQPRGSWHGGFRGHAGDAPRSAWHGGVRGPAVGSHRPPFHERFRPHSGVHTRVFIGSGFWWGDPWWWGPPYPYYAAPPVVVQEAPPVYIQQEPAPQQPYYWYYCPNPPGYYPYVQQCAEGWLTVVPPANPAGP